METRRHHDNRLLRLAHGYMKLKLKVIEAGYGAEVDWQESRCLEDITESDFLREAAWVILSSGMRETVIREKFAAISAAFFEWVSSEKIVDNQDKCAKEATRYFGHRKKISAILEVAKHVCARGFDAVWRGVRAQGIEYILQLPYMGPATSYHFAKNLGLPFAKPDRHLKRIGEIAGYSSPQLMCADIAEVTGEKISVIDLVFWRYATIDKNYLNHFSELS